MKAHKTGLDTFDHVVVLMLENRSFDNLLGNLYKEGDPAIKGKKFYGLDGKDINMPVPNYASDYHDHKFVKPHRAINFHQPYPDPGEVYNHVNTQLYNHIDHKNFDKPACAMVSNFNIPKPQPKTPEMQGFIKDYINTMKAIKCEKKACKDCKPGQETFQCKACIAYNDPKYKEYNRIMQVYYPDQVSVLSSLAKEFAVFDHWFCSVPSQTWPNRAFWHAAASGGKLVNPTDECTKWEDFKAFEHWAEHVWTQDNIFKRMHKKSVTHRVYTQELISLTSLVNGLFEDEEAVVDYELVQFKKDLNTNNLAHYSFLEPKFLGKHNDMHPSSALPGLVDSPEAGTVLLGEALIWQVYNDIFTSPYKDKTLFIITTDEHGGCFDHVAPPPNLGGKVWPPHTPPIVKPEEGFKFDRLGIRVPMVMVSAYIQKNTIMNDHFDHSSFIKTISQKYDLGHLTDRDLHAKSFESVFSGPERKVFPNIMAPLLPPEDDKKYHLHPINDLQSTIVKGAHFLAKYVQEKLRNDVEIPSHAFVKTNGDALAYLKKIHPLTKFPKNNDAKN